MNRKTILICSIVAVAFAMSACRTKQEANKTNETVVQQSSADEKADALTGKYWKLTSIYSEPIVASKDAFEAHIIFEKDGRVHGSYGCNTFNGQYTSKLGNRIAFEQMVATLKMCINDMETETKMKQALEKADSYILRGDTLQLHRARMAPLARFVAVDK